MFLLHVVFPPVSALKIHDFETSLFDQFPHWSFFKKRVVTALIGPSGFVQQVMILRDSLAATEKPVVLGAEVYANMTPFSCYLVEMVHVRLHFFPGAQEHHPPANQDIEEILRQRGTEKITQDKVTQQGFVSEHALDALHCIGDQFHARGTVSIVH